MKIIYITTVRMPTERAHGLQIMKMCEAFARLGHDVELVVPRRDNELSDNPFEYYNVKQIFRITTVSARGFVAYDRVGFWLHRVSFAYAALKHAAHSDANLAYTRDEFIAWLLSFGSRRFVYEAHEGRWNFVVRRAAQRAALVSVLTRGLKEFFTSRGVSEKKIVISPDAVDLKDFARPESREAARKRLELPLDKKVVMYIGLIDEWKGTDTFFEAADKLPRDIVPAVIGGRPEQLAKLAEKYPRVRFLGFLPYRELASNQAAADLLILPNSARHAISARDTSPLKLFTYMASGVPILASDLPSLREVLDEKTAVFFKPDDSGACARAIAEALANEDAMQARAREALIQVRAYTSHTRAEKILEAFKAL